MRFILIRHAETEWNREGRYQGQSDVSLSPEGILQVKLLAQSMKDIKIDRIYSSPLRRALDTAQELAKDRNLEVIADIRLRELDFGPWDGLTRSELKNRFGEDFQSYRREPFFYPIPGEGSLNRARLRVGESIEDILDQFRGTDKTIAIVTHGGILKLIIYYLLDISDRFYRCIELGNTSVSIIDVLKDRVMLQLLNDLHHLWNSKGQYFF